MQGEITVKGFKNSATPIIAATILTKRPCLLHNIPRIGDVFKLLEILKSIGSKQKWVSENSLEIINDNLNPENLNQELVSEIRSSILLVGPLLARFRKIKIITPGGCRIGSRPIDTHLEALKDLGAEVALDKESGIYEIKLDHLKNKKVYLKEFSVTATENLLMLGFKEPLAIHLAAIEPHVWDLIGFLRKLGAGIDYSNNSFSIRSGKELPGGEAEYFIINDPIEAGTLAVLAGATKSRIDIHGVEEKHLEAPLRKLREFGVNFKIKGKTLSVDGLNSDLRSATVKTYLYPGLPTDLQAPFGVLATQAHGTSLIFDTLYEGRLKYIDELKKMGAEAVILDSHRALITGPAVLRGAKIESLDLRAGATLIIAALAAEGETELGGIEQIDRGYENLDGRLRNLGADIQRVN